MTLYTGGSSRREVSPPITVGLRPGVRYRVALTNLPGRPGVTLYPSLEVVGTLILPPRTEASRFPVPLTFSDEDLKRAIQVQTGIRPPFAFEPFPDLDDDVRQSLARDRANPFIPHRDEVRGFVYDVRTGRLREVK